MLNAIKIFISNIYFLFTNIFTNSIITYVEASNMLTISFCNQLAEMEEQISELEKRLNELENINTRRHHEGEPEA